MTKNWNCEHQVAVVREGRSNNSWSVRLDGCHVYRYFTEDEAKGMAENLKKILAGTAEKEEESQTNAPSL